MKAMIFAAGLGTRLRPITNSMPKALAPVAGMPLLEIAIRRLKYYGCKEIIINIHHFGDRIIDFLEAKNNFGIRIVISDERDKLLDTGGGLKKASWFFTDEPFLLVNADVVTNLDLEKMYQAHLAGNAIASLAVRTRSSSRMLLFDEDKQLCGWRNTQTGEEKITRPGTGIRPWSFSGMHVISPDFFRFFPAGQEVFSIIDTYLAAAVSERILAYPHDEDIWLDVGKPERLDQAAAVLPEIPLAD